MAITRFPPPIPISDLPVLAGDSIIYVYEEEDFGEPTAGVITLEHKAYWIMNSGIILTSTLDFANGATIFNPTWRVSTLITTADPAIQSADMSQSSSIIGVLLIGTGANQLFDLTSSNDSFLSMHIAVFANFDSLGTTTDCSIVADNAAFVTFNTGLTSTGGDTYLMKSVRMRSTADTTALALDGTWGGSTIIETADITTGSGGHAFDLDSALSAPQIIIGSVVYPSAAVYDPTGLNQESPGVDSRDIQDLADSTIAGAMQFVGNSDATPIDVQGTDGAITAFADAGGGQVTVSDAAHGVRTGSNGDFVFINNTTNYNGLYTMTNVGTNDYEITHSFDGDDATGTAEYGWTNIVGTAIAGVVIERFTFSDAPNELTYTGTAITKALASVDVTATDGSSGKIFQFMMFQKPDGGIYNHIQDSRKTGEFDNRAKGLGYAVSFLMAESDVFKLMVRNTEGAEDITVIDNRVNILKA